MDRRSCLKFGAAAFAACAAGTRGRAAGAKLGIPGPYPGRVVCVDGLPSIKRGRVQPDVVRAMVQRGMCELTGAPAWQDAWKVFFEPGDIVGIKVNPQAHQAASVREIVLPIVEGLNAAGVKTDDVVLYDRYRRSLMWLEAASWLPKGAGQFWAAESYADVQTAISGYDPGHFVELPFVWSGLSPDDPVARRSHAALFITKHVNKVINLPALKDHEAAGVTLALKNMSHGLANNVNRSHADPERLRFVDFIPAIVNMPIIRERVVLHILDGIRGVYEGGPTVASTDCVWENRTLHLATDPVAMDRIGWAIIDMTRKRFKLKPVAEAGAGPLQVSPRRQPEYVLRAGELGLGVSDIGKMDQRLVKV
jgi:hypothetical protein